MTREQNLNYYVINLPLKDNRNENIELYTEFFKFLFKSKKPVKIKGDKYGLIRKCTPMENGKALFGYISTFTEIGKDWINTLTMDKEEVEIKEGLHPNLKEAIYFFFPQFHRLVVLKSSGSPNINLIVDYFLALKQKVNKYDFDVFLEKSNDAVEEVLKAEMITMLSYKITYTNADTGSEAFDFLDKEIRKSNSKEMEIKVKSRKNESIDINKSKILKGATELSKEYGEFEATVINNGVKKKIKNKEYPFLLNLRGRINDLENQVALIYDKLSKRKR